MHCTGFIQGLTEGSLSLSPFKEIRSHVWTLTWLEKSRIPAPSHPIHSSQSSQQSSPTPMNPSRLSERSSSNSPNCKVLLLSRLYTHTKRNKEQECKFQTDAKQKWEKDNWGGMEECVYLVCFVDLLEVQAAMFTITYIRVILKSESSVSLLDLMLAGARTHS